MNQHGYLVYGERLSDSYYGCDAYGYKYNDICGNYLDKLVDNSNNRETYLPWVSAKKCFEECRKLNEPANIIYCHIVNDDNIKIEEQVELACHMKFVGFDVAWKEYDFYSSIFHDVISKHGALHNQYMRLNRNGLFSKFSQAEEYLKLRNSLKSNYAEGQFEEGDFFIVAIWKHDNLDLD